MHAAALKPPVFQFHVSTVSQNLPVPWNSGKSEAREALSAPPPGTTEVPQWPVQGPVGSWSAPCTSQPSASVSEEGLSLEEMLSDGVDSSMLVAGDDDEPVPLLSSPDRLRETAALHGSSSSPIGSGGSSSPLVSPSSGLGRRSGRQSQSPSRLPVLVSRLSPEQRRRPAPQLPRPQRPPPAGPRRVTPSKPTVASVLRGQALSHGLAAGASRSRSVGRVQRSPPAGLGGYTAIHAGGAVQRQSTATLLSTAGSAQRQSTSTLLSTAGTAHRQPTVTALLSPTGRRSGISYGGTDQVDRALRAPTKHSQFAFTADDHSGSSDEDPNGITLSNTTRSKLKLLTKRNEMRKGLERAGHREPADPHHAHKEERVRNGRHPETEGVKGAVHSRLAARRNSQLTVPAANGPPTLSSPRQAPPRRAVSHERTHHARPGAHGPHLSGSEKQPHAPPSPSIERKSGSMQNLATHRPKQPTLPKSKTFGADMNKSSVPSSASSVFGQQLERFANPRQALDEAYRKLNSDDWEREVSGLTDLVRLFRHHPDTVSGDLKAVVAAIVKQMKNLRSQVLRAAVQTSAEMFQHVGRAAESNMESMVAILLQKTSDTNKFIKADSNRALDLMLENVSVSRAVAVVIGEGLGHRSSQVRATVARLLAAVVARLGPAGSLGGQKDITDKLVPAAAQLVREGDLQTRIHAKEIFHVWLQHPDLDKVLSKYLNSTVKRDVDKVIDNMRNEVPAAAATLKSVSLTLVS